MSQRTVLLIDDEKGFLEPLADALQHEGHRVLFAVTAEEALDILRKERVDLATIDIMMPPGAALEKKTSSHSAGLYLCRKITELYPELDLFCLSVVNDEDMIREVKRLGVRFLRKGETPLRTVLNMIQERLTGGSYSLDLKRRRGRE